MQTSFETLKRKEKRKKWCGGFGWWGSGTSAPPPPPPPVPPPPLTRGRPAPPFKYPSKRCTCSAKQTFTKERVSACYKKWKVEWELAQTGMCRWSTSTFENSCGCTALDMPEWWEMADQIHWRTKQLSQVACFSENLKCWGAWDTTCGHCTKDISRRREAWKEEALDDLPWKDERGPSSLRRTLEPFQRQRSGNFREAGWSAYGLFRAHKYHLWTELNARRMQGMNESRLITTTLWRHARHICRMN